MVNWSLFGQKYGPIHSPRWYMIKIIDGFKDTNQNEDKKKK